MNNHNQFIQLVRQCVIDALAKYDIKHVDVNAIDINCNTRGKAAGWMKYKGSQYTLSFNGEAVDKYWDDMVEDTMPHEVAHLICHAGRIGNGHDRSWKRVCIELGGSGNRTHRLDLTPARTVTKYDYKVNGQIVSLGAKRHSRLQKGIATYRVLLDGVRYMMHPSMWIDSGKQTVACASKPADNTRRSTAVKGSKVEIVKTILRNMAQSNADSNEIIRTIMANADMTKAGATTYYYKYRNQV